MPAKRQSSAKKISSRKRPRTSHGAARVLLVRSNGDILCTEESNKSYKGKLLLPGGKLEPGETPQDGGIREFREEVGLDLTEACYSLRGIAECADASKQTFFVYSTTQDPQPQPDGDEVVRCHWVSLLDLQNTPPLPLHYCASTAISRCVTLLSDCQPEPDLGAFGVELSSKPPSDPGDSPTEPPPQDAAEPPPEAATEPPPETPAKNLRSPSPQTHHCFSEILSVHGLRFVSKFSISKFISYFDSDPESTEDGETQTVLEQYELMRAFVTDALGHEPQDFHGQQVVAIKRDYYPSSASPEGRVFVEGSPRSGLGLQRLWGKLRAALVRDLTCDYDMRNAHPTICLYLCKTHFPGQEWWKPIRKYVENREALWEQLIEAGIPTPKVEVLRSLNSSWQIAKASTGKPIPKRSCTHFHALDVALKMMQKQLTNVPEYHRFLNDLGQKNKHGRFINRILCFHENTVLQAAIRAVGRGNVIAPMFDGMLCHKTLDTTATLALLNKLPESVERGISWTQKEHDMDIQVDETYEGRQCYVAPTDVALVRLLSLELFKQGRLACCRGALWYLNGDEVHVALAQDHRKHEVVVQRLFHELQDCELAFGKENKDPFGPESRVMVHTQVGLLMAFCKTVCRQAVIDDGFEARYWAAEPNDSYSRAIHKINQSTIHLREKAVFLCMQEDGVIEELTADEIRNNLRDTVDISFETWLSSIKHNSADRDVFVPTLKPEHQNPKYFNLFRGLDIQHKHCRDADPDACKPLLKHIHEVLARGHDRVFRAIVLTWARMLQGVEHGHLDWIKSNVCMLFLSRPGAGKGTPTRHLRTIIGPKYSCQLSKKRQLFGDFNDNTGRDKLWVEMDELLWAGNHEHANDFKNMITEDTQTVNAKFKKERAYDSYHNYIITTNSDWAAQIDRDDRRFAAYDCADTYAGLLTAENREYFSRLNDPKTGPKTISLSFAKFLYELEGTTDFIPTMSIIDTIGRREQKIQSLSAVEQMVVCWLERGYVLTSTDLEHGQLLLIHQNRQLVPVTVLFKNAHREFSRIQGFPNTMLKFAQALHKVMGNTLITVSVGMARENCKQFAGLNATRLHMNKYLGWKFFTGGNLAGEHPDPAFWWVLR